MIFYLIGTCVKDKRLILFARTMHTYEKRLFLYDRIMLKKYYLYMIGPCVKKNHFYLLGPCAKKKKKKDYSYLIGPSVKIFFFNLIGACTKK